ncbi:MAG TPA: site-specific integrase [Chthoniobacteraceae bacterium]|nr:site-specific integrase [Chthoniobacteraceae bacterium]
MASLRKIPGCKNWIACFTDKDGRRRQRSTSETDRKKAQKIADGYETAARQKRTVRQIRSVLSELSEMVTGEGLKVVSFGGYVKDWLERKTHEVSDSTKVSYEDALQSFVVFLGPKAEREISDITETEVVAFRNARMEAGFARPTVNKALKSLRLIFKEARSEGLIADDPTEFVKAVKETGGANQNDRRPFTRDEIDLVLKRCSPEWRSMVLFGLYTGQRLSDLALLTWGNIDLPARELRMVASKTSKTIVIPLAGPLWEHVQCLLKPTPPDTVVTKRSPSTPIHRECYDLRAKTKGSAGLSNAFAKILEAAGLREKSTKQKLEGGRGRSAPRKSRGLSFHCLRHTAVTMLKEAGIPAAVVMELVGHDSKAVSQHYTHVGSEALRKAAEAFPEL